MNQRAFCIAGPINPELHYFIPHRLDWVDLHRLIRNSEYFVLHAPRQSGKTTAILEYCLQLNSEGNYNAIYFNVESAQAVRENVEKGLLSILISLHQALENQMPMEIGVIEFLKKMISDHDAINFNSLNLALEYLAKHSSKPVVLFIDEIDSLIGDTLLSVLANSRRVCQSSEALSPRIMSDRLA